MTYVVLSVPYFATVPVAFRSLAVTLPEKYPSPETSSLFDGVVVPTPTFPDALQLLRLIPVYLHMQVDEPVRRDHRVEVEIASNFALGADDVEYGIVPVANGGMTIWFWLKV